MEQTAASFDFSGQGAGELTAAPIRILEDFLASPRVPKGALSLLALDGYLTAVVLAPDLIMPGEWLPGIWSADSPVFADGAEAQAFLGALMARYNEILLQLAQLDPRPLYLPADPADRPAVERVAQWAKGFWKGMLLRSGDWGELVHDRDARDVLAPIVCFVEDDNGRRVLQGVRDDDDPLLLGAGDLIPRCLLAIRKYWRRGSGVPPSAARRAPRVGRNEPCPCGSGRKYKRCCGAR